MKRILHLTLVVVSPGDVEKERDIVEKVAEELNSGFARDRELRLDVLRWETDAHPGFHVDGPQGLIDPVLRIEESDVVVGILWKRFGSPTMDAESGTEHEFKKAFESWKKTGRPQILFYFNQEPYSPADVKEAEQRVKVLRFKESFPKEGLWDDYSGAVDFEKRIRTHLKNYIGQHFAFPPKSPPDPATRPTFVKRLKGPEAVYGALNAYLEEFPYLLNTVFSEEGAIFPLDSYRKRYYDLKLRLVLQEKLKCKELYAEQILTLKKKGSGLTRLSARFDARSIPPPNWTSTIGFCVFLEDEHDLERGVAMFGWLLDEENVTEDQECLATNEPEIVELFARHFLALYKDAEKHVWP
jgi:hypothetical protein